MAEIGRMSVTVTANTKDLVNTIQRDGDQAAKGLSSKLSGAFGTIGKAALVAGGVAAAAGTAAAAFGVKVAAANQSAQVSFETLLGSEEKAGAFLKDLYAFAAKTPFEIQGLRDSASRLVATGVEANRVIPIMEALGDATAAMGTGAQGIDRAVTAIQQMSNAGRVTAGEMNQLAQAGIPAWNALAAAIGKSPAEVRELVSKGKVEVDTLLDAIQNKTGSTFATVAGTMEAQSQTFAGQISTLKDTLQMTLADAAQPLLESLQKALPSITSAIDGAVKGFEPVFKALGGLAEAITPLIEPLAKVLGTLGGTVITALVDSIKALLPALTPVLEIFQDLAVRIGPIFEKVLSKVVQILGRVLEVVTPLLDPLIDLVFVILDAAWPIIEIVADTLLILIDALAPLLIIVGSLLGPIGDLVKLGFGAFMPVLQPLLPLIEALAVVLADVLGRAIGLVITAAGYLIQAWSKVGSFLIGNVLRPMVSAFLAWAQDIVGAAATAFGWVPGLGDKLNAAKDAIATFRTNAEKGMSDAAATIGTKGEEIGKNLVEQGIATMKDPAAQSRYRQAGTQLGVSAAKGLNAGMMREQAGVTLTADRLGQNVNVGIRRGLTSTTSATVSAAVRVGENTAGGLAQGIANGTPQVNESARVLASGLTTTARTELGVRSPSTVFMGIGENLVQGLQQGIETAWMNFSSFWSQKIGSVITGAKSVLGIASPSKVFITMGGNVVEGFGLGLQAIGKVNQEFIDKLDKAVQTSEAKIDKWVQATKKQLDDAVKAWQDYRDQVFTSITGNVNFVDAMNQTEEQQKAVRDAQKALQEAQAQASAPNATQSDKDAVLRAQQELATAQAAVRNFEENLGTMLDQSDFFGTAFQKASDALAAQFGMNSPIWTMMTQQMLQAGPQQGAALANYIATQGLSPDMEKRLLNWNMWAGQVATDQANKSKGQGVAMAMQAMNGLNEKVKAERERIVQIGERIGDGVVVGFKNKESDFKNAVNGYINAAMATLGIRSPSRVFMQIGEYTAEGFNNGYESSIIDPSSMVPPSVRFYAPSAFTEPSGPSQGSDNLNIQVFLGDKELTDLVDVQIQANDSQQRDLVIAGRRF